MLRTGEGEGTGQLKVQGGTSRHQGGVRGSDETGKNLGRIDPYSHDGNVKKKKSPGGKGDKGNPLRRKYLVCTGKQRRRK